MKLELTIKLNSLLMLVKDASHHLATLPFNFLPLKQAPTPQPPTALQNESKMRAK